MCLAFPVLSPSPTCKTIDIEEAAKEIVMTTEKFNAQNALYAAVKANDVAKAKELLEGGAKPDSHMLAVALNDDFAIPQRKGSVSSDDLLMAHLLIKHGADVNGNGHEPIVAAFNKPSILAILLVADIPGADCKGALQSMKKLPQYAGPEFAGGKQFLRHFVRSQNTIEKRVVRAVSALKEKFGGPKR
jgi:hypothetical protein